MDGLDILLVQRGRGRSETARALEALGHRVFRVEAPARAAARVEAQDFGAVLLDLPAEGLSPSALEALARRGGPVVIAVVETSESEAAAERLLPLGVEYLCREPGAGHLGRVGAVVRDALSRRCAARAEGAEKVDLRTLLLNRIMAGVAHDLNNALSGVVGYASLLEHLLDENDSRRRPAREILEAAERAAALTGQALVYAREEREAPRKLPVNALVQGLVGLLRATLPRSVTVETHLAEGACSAWAPPGAFMDVLAAVCLEAGEAMGENPGVMSIATGEVAGGEGGRDAVAVDVLYPAAPAGERARPRHGRGGVRVEPIPLEAVRAAAAQIGAEVTAGSAEDGRTQIRLTVPCP